MSKQFWNAIRLFIIIFFVFVLGLLTSSLFFACLFHFAIIAQAKYGFLGTWFAIFLVVLVYVTVRGGWVIATLFPAIELPRFFRCKHCNKLDAFSASLISMQDMNFIVCSNCGNKNEKNKSKDEGKRMEK